MWFSRQIIKERIQPLIIFNICCFPRATLVTRTLLSVTLYVRCLFCQF
jgi:hypothetical protein